MSVGTQQIITCWHFVTSAVLLWWAGCCEALKIHRCVVFFVYDNRILTKFSQCFLLNGCIFGGSNLVLHYALAPGIHWLVSTGPLVWVGDNFAKTLEAVLIQAFVILWLLPAYGISLAVNSLWYQELAELANEVVQVRAVASRGLHARKAILKASPPPVVHFIAQEIYRVVLFLVFWVEVLLTSYMPYIGFGTYFVMVSWLWAFYCFDYKWSLTNYPLESRIRFFEENWPFMAGFGSVVVLPAVTLSLYTGAAVTGVLFPMFMLVSCEADPRKAAQAVAASEAAVGRRLRLGRLPVFYVSTHVTTFLVKTFPPALRTVVKSVQRVRRWFGTS